MRTETAYRSDRDDTRLVGVHTDIDTHRALKIRATKQGVSMTALLLRMVAAELATDGDPLPPGLVRALAELEKTGRRRTHPRGE